MREAIYFVDTAELSPERVALRHQKHGIVYGKKSSALAQSSWKTFRSARMTTATGSPLRAPARSKRFEFQEVATGAFQKLGPGLERFLNDATMSGDITEEEAQFLKRLKFSGRRPSALYYYRELQNLRDPLHFSAAGDGGTGKKG
jgi:hypothetical protein